MSVVQGEDFFFDSLEIMSQSDSSEALLPALPLTVDDTDEPPAFSFDDGDAEAYLRSVRWEAKRICTNAENLVKSQTFAAQASRAISEISPTDTSLHQNEEQLAAKRRCGYVEYLLQLETRAADNPLPFCPHNESAKHTAAPLEQARNNTGFGHTNVRCADIDDDYWRAEALKSFGELRMVGLLICFIAYSPC